MGAPMNRGGKNREAVLIWSLLLVLGLLVGAFEAAFLVSAKLHGIERSTANPAAALLAVARGREPWFTSGTVIMGALLALVLLAGVLLFWRWLARDAKRSRVDAAAAHMARPKDLAHMSGKGAQRDAARLGVSESPGLPIGATLAGRQLVSGWENVCVDIWGPRTGKTTSRAIPGVVEAPGAVLATSNKRDLVDATRGVREKVGDVWVFDPQGICEERPDSWWWNPLSFVTNEVKAQELAGHFASGSRAGDARPDAFFDPAGQELLAGLLLAAALSNESIRKVYHWLNRENEDSPVRILEAGGYSEMADSVRGHIYAPDKQRGGVYGTARQMASCLTNQAVLRWITPQGPNDTRKQFDPHEFVKGRNTLFSLSKEGKGTAGPLVTALTVAVVDAAESLAVKEGGRLRLPLVAMLDEAANVCRWSELPNLYSHYGSRGIVICTILQSWSQGKEVWGENGMKKLWSAANIKVFGGGVSEADFLEDVSRLIGDYIYSNDTSSRGKQGTTWSHDPDRKDRILDAAELGAMPRGRAVVFASGAPAVLVKTQPWFEGKHKDEIEESLSRFDPSKRKAETA